jgi:hypothetical protein
VAYPRSHTINFTWNRPNYRLKLQEMDFDEKKFNPMLEKCILKLKSKAVTMQMGSVEGRHRKCRSSVLVSSPYSA